MTLEVSAPGKLVLLGEYAVLFGAPAAVMAIERRARVSIDASASGRGTISSPGLAEEAIGFEIIRDGSLRWSDPGRAEREFGLVDRLIRELGERTVLDLTNLRPFDAILDTRSFFEDHDDGRYKLGLGSSAALATALATALVGWLKGRCPQPTVEWLTALVAAHRSVQGGRGSGIDVAASLLGGVVRYRVDSEGGVDEVAALTLPGDLQTHCIWTGRSASTGDFLARLDHCRDRDSRSVHAALDRLGALSEQGIEALTKNQTTVFLDVVDAFTEALDELGCAIEMPIFSPEHRELKTLAFECGVHYKPSGAGGGDFGLAFTTGEQMTAEFFERVDAAGYRVASLGIDPNGAMEDRD